MRHLKTNKMNIMSELNGFREKTIYIKCDSPETMGFVHNKICHEYMLCMDDIAVDKITTLFTFIGGEKIRLFAEPLPEFYVHEDQNVDAVYEVLN